jgi:PAS domain S-box-containing protein
MALPRSVRNLLVGPEIIESRIEYKSALLRGYMALIAISVGIAYIFINVRNGLQVNYGYYIGVIVMSVATILLNRNRMFQVANLLFLLTINGLIFLFATSDFYRTGIYMFFICISLSAFALLGYRNIQYAFAFCALSLALFVIAYWGNLTLLPVIPNDHRYVNITFTVNFLIAFVTTILIVYSLININHHSEDELIKATEQLQRSRERNEMVVEAVNAGIYEWYSANRGIFVSPTWKRLLGYDENELRNINLETVYSMVHRDDRIQIRQNLDQHFKNKIPYAHELRLRTKKGDYVWFHDSGHTKFDADGKPLITVGSIIDIHDRKLAEEKIRLQNNLLVKTNRELDHFVYSVSHDLRAPLSSIMGLTNVYGLSADNREKEVIVKLISERANTLDDFIREILDYSRNARTELKINLLNVRKLVGDVLTGLAHMNGLERIQIETEIPTDLEVMSDSDRLKIILNNMISNAVKYSDPHKKSFIYIRSFVEDMQWILSVHDNGIGIEQQHHERIFEMFYQAHSNAQGSGLGLYILKEAVQRLNGKISVVSEYGAGSTFTLSLPMRHPAHIPVSATR